MFLAVTFRKNKTKQCYKSEDVKLVTIDPELRNYVIFSSQFKISNDKKSINLSLSCSKKRFICNLFLYSKYLDILIINFAPQTCKLCKIDRNCPIPTAINRTV